MGKKAVIALLIVIVIMITGALVATIIFLPSSDVVANTVTYDALNKTTYKYTASKVLEEKEEQHEVTQSKVNEGLKADDYVPGRTNPFTPLNEISVYNEPGSLDTDSYIDKGAGYFGSTTKGNSTSTGSGSITTGGSSGK